MNLWGVSPFGVPAEASAKVGTWLYAQERAKPHSGVFAIR